jgi:hypothetical protein
MAKAAHQGVWLRPLVRRWDHRPCEAIDFKLERLPVAHATFDPQPG